MFGGDRISDFRRRLEGATYEEIARADGGIVSTVRATRAANDDELFETANQRVRWLMRSGVATIEIKSGYGLDLETELRMLRVARQIGKEMSVRVTTSLLAAHAIPREHADSPDLYIDQVCHEIIPAAAEEGVADVVDAFCEGIAFTPEQVARVFAAAADVGLPVRLHADQLSDLSGAALAADHNALSADHLEHASSSGIRRLAETGTVAVLIPGAATFLDEDHKPPVVAMREAGVRMAVASDLNPGTAPLASMQLAMALACSRFKLTPIEALRGATTNAAAALGADDTGRIGVGLPADLALWNVSTPAELCYWFGAELLDELWIGGQRPIELENP